jgi:NADH-quinone oxidoreductase subunit L
MFRLVIVTFHGKPRNQEKYDHAHESPLAMVIPLVVLSALSIFIFYTPNPFNSEAGWVLSDWIRTPESVVPNEVRFDFMKTDAMTGQDEITHSQMYTDAVHHAHYPAMIISLVLAGLGILIAFLMYIKKKIDSEKLKQKYNSLYKFSLNKWYIDEFYHASFISGTLSLSRILAWFDYNIVDGIVNGTAAAGRFISSVSGWFDKYIVDGLVNLFALLNGFFGLTLRRIQTGKVQTYVVLVVFSLLILMFFFRPF